MFLRIGKPRQSSRRNWLASRLRFPARSRSRLPLHLFSHTSPLLCVGFLLCLLPDSGFGGPQRIVSLDYCSDQYVLKFVDRDQIVGLSPDATRSFSYLRDLAQGVATVKPTAEDVLLLQPDLVVRTYGGDTRLLGFLKRLDVPVLQIGYAETLVDMKDISSRVAEALGEADRGRLLVAEIDERLDRIESRDLGKSVLYMTASGYTTGPATPIHQLIQAAGLENFERRPGWHPLPLERLAYERPDLLAVAFSDHSHSQTNLWSTMRHPLIRERLENTPSVEIPGAWTSCPAWFLLDAIEALAGAGGHGSR